MELIARNNIQISGDGDRVILFGHGFGCDQNTWRAIVPAFKEGFKIVLFDYVGAGKSDLLAYDESRYSSLEGYALDVIEICNGLDLRNVTFVGHSVSSMIGLLAVKKDQSRFEKIIFIGPSPCYLNKPGYMGGIDSEDIENLLEVMDSNYLGWSATIAPLIMGTENPKELADSLQASFCATDPSIARKFARVTFLSDNRDDLDGLGIPSLTIQCKDDFLTSASIAKYMNERMSLNQITLLESSGHCPHLSDPEGVIQAMKSFI
ncbi:MAG: alpha/beta hydrolase [Pedobacter sp.]|nr:MAG: alpha/beta hydrolase [Pedobacter sp.]